MRLGQALEKQVEEKVSGSFCLGDHCLGLAHLRIRNISSEELKKQWITLHSLKNSFINMIQLKDKGQCLAEQKEVLSYKCLNDSYETSIKVLKCLRSLRWVS